jgi:hypothetical protein
MRECRIVHSLPATSMHSASRGGPVHPVAGVCPAGYSMTASGVDSCSLADLFTLLGTAAGMAPAS